MVKILHPNDLDPDVYRRYEPIRGRAVIFLPDDDWLLSAKLCNLVKFRVPKLPDNGSTCLVRRKMAGSHNMGFPTINGRVFNKVFLVPASQRKSCRYTFNATLFEASQVQSMALVRLQRMPHYVQKEEGGCTHYAFSSTSLAICAGCQEELNLEILCQQQDNQQQTQTAAASGCDNADCGLAKLFPLAAAAAAAASR